MNIKSVLLSIALLSVVPVLSSQAYVSDHSLMRTATGTVQSVEPVTNFWYQYRLDDNSIQALLKRGIYGFQYVTLRKNKTSSTGITELGIEYPDELDKDWTVIFYLAESTAYDRSVFAVNNKDGTVTIYEPGHAPY